MNLMIPNSITHLKVMSDFLQCTLFILLVGCADLS